MHKEVNLQKVASLLFLLLLASGLVVSAGPVREHRSSGLAEDSTASDPEKKNIDEYTKLLHENVSQQSAQITGAVMQLTPEESKKFWPLYEEYRTALIKLNHSRIQNLQNYASDFAQMTDDKADQVIKEDLNLRRQRDQLLAQSYDRMKQSLGALTAARFLLVESQLQAISDLQLDSRLPIEG
jgi:hypothetical protein